MVSKIIYTFSFFLISAKRRCVATRSSPGRQATTTKEDLPALTAELAKVIEAKEAAVKAERYPQGTAPGEPDRHGTIPEP